MHSIAKLFGLRMMGVGLGVDAIGGCSIEWKGCVEEGVTASFNYKYALGLSYQKLGLYVNCTPLLPRRNSP
jgi:hypothetical protein